DVEDYRQAIEAGQRKHTTVVTATFQVGDSEVEAIENAFGKDVLPDRKLTYSKLYDNSATVGLVVNEKIAGIKLLNSAGMEGEIKSSGWKTLQELETLWESVAKSKTEASIAAKSKLANIADPDEKKKAETSAIQLEESN